ncbi:xanthine dehydrogenase accessory protein XdhC [Ottowia sp. GY511]|uniref:Xanthine dehydrogenase accessory protein XdhC n=1 Tax=Ottowia flava TaxID=2675430 RepID=A0ABW4KWY5_9BURK|nr:xanthine dehydrogenase accessory protein XdhC [Ottowia sp. GY511]TXK33567.1 xanthine dehydrogenase accessory protein XdhC [Ottowia sp. GY511]
MTQLTELFDRLERATAVLVTVASTQGSAPREAGAWMAVWQEGQVGSIGGGQLEWQALAHARQVLAGNAPAGETLRYALGPSLAQCCGGVVQLRFERVDATQGEALRQRLASAQPPVALFGGGHVGRAIVKLLSDLPFDVLWVDSRDEVFPPDTPQHVRCDHSDPVQAAVTDMAPGSRVVIMSFSHAEDFDILVACLLRQRGQGDLPYIGLIGSKTKWASFRRRLRERGFSDAELAHVTCPIGVPGITGKAPAVVAVATVAQLLQTVPVA